jgi:hypothetical protein
VSPSLVYVTRCLLNNPRCASAEDDKTLARSAEVANNRVLEKYICMRVKLGRKGTTASP